MTKFSLVFLFLISLACNTWGQVTTDINYNNRRLGSIEDARDTLEAPAIPDSIKNMKDRWVESDSSLRTELSSRLMNQELHQKKDSILALRRIFSERKIKQIYDSLNYLSTISNLKKQEWPEEEYKEMVNDKFNPLPKDSVRVPDLSQQTLSQDALSRLKALGSKQIPEEYIQKIDSICKVNLKEQGLRLKEKQISNIYEEINLQEKEKFWDKAYLEGILGIAEFDGSFFHLIPAMGYHLFGDLSVGAGPVIQFDKPGDLGKWNTALGFRQFIKEEFWNRRAYLQVEYLFSPQAVRPDELAIDKHAILAGGGIILPMSENFGINISGIYQMNKSRQSAVSPFQIRLGISIMSQTKDR